MSLERDGRGKVISRSTVERQWIRCECIDDTEALASGAYILLFVLMKGHEEKRRLEIDDEWIVENVRFTFNELLRGDIEKSKKERMT
jgi:hypothetical protein